MPHPIPLTREAFCGQWTTETLHRIRSATYQRWLESMDDVRDMEEEIRLMNEEIRLRLLGNLPFDPMTGGAPDYAAPASHPLHP